MFTFIICQITHSTNTTSAFNPWLQVCKLFGELVFITLVVTSSDDLSHREKFTVISTFLLLGPCNFVWRNFDLNPNKINMRSAVRWVSVLWIKAPYHMLAPSWLYHGLSRSVWPYLVKLKSLADFVVFKAVGKILILLWQMFLVTNGLILRKLTMVFGHTELITVDTECIWHVRKVEIRPSANWRQWSVWPDWTIYCTLGNFSKPGATIILPTFLGNFCKKSFTLLVKSFLGNCYRHLATFYWSH